MTGSAAMCRRGTLRAAVLAVFAWVALFSALFHYHQNAQGAAVSVSAAWQGTATRTGNAAGAQVSSAPAAETDCLICAAGGIQSGTPALQPGIGALRPACEVLPAPAPVPATAAAVAALPRAPPARLA